MADWKQIYEDKFNEGAKGFDDQRRQYESAMQAEELALQQNKNTAVANAGKDFENASQQAYITRTMAEKNMPQRLAAQGITGGMAETTNANIFRDFLNSKNAANTAYSKAKTELENNYMNSSAGIRSSWTQKMADLDAQQRSQALEQARFAYQIAVDEEERRRKEAASRRGGKSGNNGKGNGKNNQPTHMELYDRNGKSAGYTSIENYNKNKRHYSFYTAYPVTKKY